MRRSEPTGSMREEHGRRWRCFFPGFVMAALLIALWVESKPLVGILNHYHFVPFAVLVAALIIEVAVFIRNGMQHTRLFWSVAGTVILIICTIIVPIATCDDSEPYMRLCGINSFLLTFILGAFGILCLSAGLLGRAVFAHALRYCCILLLATIFLLPFYWMFVNSLKSFNEVFQKPDLLPKTWRWANYSQIFGDPQLPFGRYFRNTFIIAIAATAGQLVSCSIVAYAFARLRFRGREFLFLIVLATMMIPFQVTMIPLYIGFIHLNEVRFLGLAWLNSMLPIIVPQLFATAFNVFLLRQFYRTIPYELDEAALIDGCNRFGIFWRVVLPLSKPALIIVGMFTFFWNWKDLMGPLIYLNSRDNTTISVGLTFLKNPKHIDWQLIMAAATISLVPVVILFVIGQRYIIKGITMTGMKA